MRMLAVLAAACFAHGAAHAACPPDGQTRIQLQDLRLAKWTLADDGQRQRLAIGMLGCLTSVDPILRDEIGFESLQSWMRAGQLTPATMQTIRSTLLERLTAEDLEGVSRPFAALVLAEVVRADRIKPYLDAAERATLAQAAASYVSTVHDFRGFDEKAGWRHGVAHGADLLLQLSVHPQLSKKEQEAMLAAIAVQIKNAGTDSHFYHYGEGERLMAPVFYLARRDQLTALDWSAWFATLAPEPAQNRATQNTLAYRHNLQSLLLPLYVSLSETKDAAQRDRILPFVTKSLRQLD